MKTIQSTVQTAAMAAALCLGLSQGLAAACVLSTGESADLALGQPGLVSGTANTGGLSAASLDVPERLSSDGVHLVVPDAVNNRVLLWNSLPTGTGQGADVVLGQSGFTTNLANQGGPAAANTLYEPGAAFVAGGHLFVSDYGNNRVLIWNSIPTANDTPADLVLGQTAFSGAAVNAGGLSASSLYQPGGVKFEAGRLLVADAFNHRILIWNSLPTASGQAADLVLGQGGFTTNNPGSGPTGFLYPNDVETDGTQLYVVDANQNRVLGYNSFPSANGQAADFAVGQTSLFGTSQGAGAASLYAMNAVLLSGGNLYISDYGNNRVLAYSPAPTSSGAAAGLVLGQTGFGLAAANQGLASPSASTLSWPYGLTMAGGELWVSDVANNRVVRYCAGLPPTATPTVTATPTATATYTATPTATPTATATPGPNQACPVGSTLPAGYSGAANPGDLLVSPVNSNHILRFNLATRSFSLYGAAADQGPVNGLAFDPAHPGALFIGYNGTGSVGWVDPNGVDHGVWASYGASGGPQMGNIAPDGTLWIPDQASNWLVHFPVSGGAGSGVTVTVSPAPGAPCGLAWDNLGNLYIGDALNGTGGAAGRILKVAPANQAGNPMAATVLADSPLLLNSGRLVYDGDRSIYTTNSYAVGKGNVVKVDTITGAVSAVATSFAPLAQNGGGSLYQTTGMNVDLQGDLWISQTTNPVVNGTVGLLELGPNGQPLAYYPYPATVGGVSTSGWGAGDIAVLGAPSIRVCGGASPTPTPGACAACGNYDGIYGFNQFNLNVQDGIGFNYGNGTWKGGAGAAPVYAPEGSNSSLSGFIPRGARPEAVLLYNAAYLPPTQLWQSMWFQVSQHASAAEMVLMDYQSQGYRLRFSVFGPGHADFGKMKVVYSTASGNKTVFLPWAYGAGPVDDTTAWMPISPARHVFSFSLSACGLQVLPGWVDPNTNFEGLNLNLNLPDYAANPRNSGAWLAFGNQANLGAPVDGYIDDIRVYRCGTFTAPTLTPTPPVGAPSPQPTQGPWTGDEGHVRVRCWPNYSRGDEDHIGVDFRSHVGGYCSVKVMRGSNRGVRDLWQGSLLAHDSLHRDWDCHGDHGEKMASGVYYVVFTDGDGSCFTQKVLIIR